MTLIGRGRREIRQGDVAEFLQAACAINIGGFVISLVDDLQIGKINAGVPAGARPDRDQNKQAHRRLGVGQQQQFLLAEREQQTVDQPLPGRREDEIPDEAQEQRADDRGEKENRPLNVARLHLAVEQQRQRDRQQRDQDRDGNGVERCCW